MTAVDEQSGSILWSNSYTFGGFAGQVLSTSGPAYANGVVYYQTQNAGDVNLLRGVNAVTGAKVFATPYDAQFDTYLNPTPYAGAVYAGGGTFGGIYSYNGTTGSQNWFGYDAQFDEWTPAVDGKYAYTFTGDGDTDPIHGQFRMISLATGSTAHLVTDTKFQWNVFGARASRECHAGVVVATTTTTRCRPATYVPTFAPPWAASWRITK
jgi:hypothetical protein